jgi:hypothetical protein
MIEATLEASPLLEFEDVRVFESSFASVEFEEFVDVDDREVAAPGL